MNEKKKHGNKILIVTTTPFPYHYSSANLLRLFSKGLVKNGANVEVLIQKGQSLGQDKNDLNVGFKKHSEIDGIRFNYCFNAKKSPLLFVKIIDILIGIILPPFLILKKRITKDIDIVITFCDYFYEIFFVFCICKILRIPIVTYEVDWYNIFPNYFKKASFHLKIRFLFLFNGIIVISHFFKNYFSSRGYPDHHIFLLPNLIEKNDLGEYQIKESNSVNKNLILCYSGSATEKDGIMDLFRAFRLVLEKNNSIYLQIVGGTPEVLGKLKTEVQQMGIEGNVIFKGWVVSGEIPGLLQNADILLLTRPSSREANAGFPTKLGEYFLSGKPTVLTTVGDLPTYLVHGVHTLFAKPGDPQSMADQIQNLIDDKNLRNNIGKNGYQWALDNLDYVKKTNEVLAFLNRLP